jgi:hypothetical protein
MLRKCATLLDNPTFSDMLAQYHVWRGPPPVAADDIVGFQGYRKLLDFRFGREVQGIWVELTPLEFRQYQIWQQDCAEGNIRHYLADSDILTAPPYDVSHNGNIAEDFKQSASASDWDAMEQVMKQHGDFDFKITGVPGFCNLTTTGLQNILVLI